MPGVLEYPIGSAFRVTMQKRWKNTPSVKWENIYDVVATDDGVLASLEALADTLASFEQGLHTNGVEIVAAEVRTWLPDSSPYDPTAFAVFPFGYVGMNGNGNASQPLDTCLMVRRQVLSGRQGTLAYRSALTTGSVAVIEGQRSLVNPGAIQDGMEANITTSGLAGYLADGGNPLKLAIITPGTPPAVREYLGLLVDTVGVVKMKHKWFNRG